MNSILKKGFAAAGFVGLLALVLMVGVVGFAVYSTQTQNKDNQSHASNNGLEDTTKLNVTVTTNTNSDNKTRTDVHVKWTNPPNPDPSAHFGVTVRTSDNMAVDFPPTQDETLMTVNSSQTTYTKDFIEVPLHNGQYYAQVRYIPSDTTKPILRQRTNFAVAGADPKPKSPPPPQAASPCEGAGFYMDSSKNKPGSYNISPNLSANVVEPGTNIVVKAQDNSNKGDIGQGLIQASLSIRGSTTMSKIDSDPWCSVNRTGFQCNGNQGVVRYYISNKVPAGNRALITLSYTVNYSADKNPISCGPITLVVTQKPPP